MSSGAAEGGVRTWLRLEGVAVCLAAGTVYAGHGHSWLVFAALFLLPDVSFAGYLAGPRVGAAAYNIAHSYVGPVLVAIAALLAGTTPMLALVWAAHIGFDRALGYGLKYRTSFGDTHLGRIGPRVEKEPAGRRP